MNYRLRDGLTRGGTDNNGSYVANNATLLQNAASGAYPDVYIANWRDYTAPVRSWFVPDGIHYQPVGALGSADYLSRWITFLFDEPCPKPMTVGGPIANSVHLTRRPVPHPTSSPSTASGRRTGRRYCLTFTRRTEPAIMVVFGAPGVCSSTVPGARPRGHRLIDQGPAVGLAASEWTLAIAPFT